MCRARAVQRHNADGINTWDCYIINHSATYVPAHFLFVINGPGEGRDAAENLGQFVAYPCEKPMGHRTARIVVDGQKQWYEVHRQRKELSWPLVTMRSLSIAPVKCST